MRIASFVGLIVATVTMGVEVPAARAEGGPAAPATSPAPSSASNPVPTVAQAPAPANAPDVAEPPPPAAAVKADAPKKMVQWSVFDFQYLYGFNWNLGPKRKDVLTLEHADGWSLGDNYLFVDVYHIANQETQTSLYGEWQPRFSLSKLFKVDLNHGLLNDVLESNRLAFGGGFLAYLVGGAIDLNIPGFAYWHQHVFLRRDVHLDGVTWQTTSEWSLPFELGPVRFVFDGFAHFIGAQGTSSFNIITQPQLLLDLGNFGAYKDQVLVGCEVDIRHNEFGIQGQDEVVPQAMVEWKL